MSRIYHVDKDDIRLRGSRSITDKCIIIDLDQTLVSTQDSLEDLKNLNILSNPKYMKLRNRIFSIILEDFDAPGIGLDHDMWTIVRPNVYEFLVFCFNYFKIVAIWSAGHRDYVEAIVDKLFKDLPRPDIIFTADDTITATDKNTEKPLYLMMKYNHEILPENTLALDDIDTNFRKNKDNGILIPEYKPTLTIKSIEKDDNNLIKLKMWLMRPDVINSSDVRILDKSKIFR